ncbi:MAG: DNA polymerase III subunit delta', partial [Pseudomonadales bacterium]|nr:DNA polymerase III subunit delta' [Pseudomonadales bacterium]
MSSFLDITSPALPYPWQQRQWEQIVGSQKSGRLPHALLFLGAQGVGKQNFAASLVDRMLCQQREKQGKGESACGECKSCLLRISGSHPDLKIIERLEKKKNISIDQVREVGNFLSKRAQLDGYRCIVVNGAEDMTESAANALLKVLEEPGEQCLLILISAKTGAVMPTIKSRCQHLHFHVPSLEQSLLWLTPLVRDHEQAKTLLAITGGAPLKALQAQQWAWLDQRELIAKQLLALRLRQAEPLVVAKSLQELPIEELLLWLYQWALDWVKLGQGLPIDNQDLSLVF